MTSKQTTRAPDKEDSADNEAESKNQAAAKKETTVKAAPKDTIKRVIISKWPFENNQPEVETPQPRKEPKSQDPEPDKAESQKPTNNKDANPRNVTEHKGTTTPLRLEHGQRGVPPIPKITAQKTEARVPNGL